MGRIKILIFLVAVLVTGCNSYEGLVNYKEVSDAPLDIKPIQNYEPIKVQPSDILQIEVSSTEAKAVAIFNEYQSTGFTVSEKGTIDFPLVGKINLEGKTIEETKELVLNSIRKYFVTAPTVNVRLANFNITVNGEIRSPGTFLIENDRVSIIEAVTRAGDFTPYSKRDSVMILREDGKTRSFGYVNFNSSEIFKSPYFYLKQNDVIYIKPNKGVLGTVSSRRDKLLPFVSVGISVILLAITVSRN